MDEYDKYRVKLKEKLKYIKKENISCLVCEKKTDNENIKGVAVENKIGQQKPTYFDCDSKKINFFRTSKKQKIVLQILRTKCKSYKKQTECTYEKKKISFNIKLKSKSKIKMR